MNNPIGNLATDLRTLAEELAYIADAYDKATGEDNDDDKHFHLNATIQGLDETVQKHLNILVETDSGIEKARTEQRWKEVAKSWEKWFAEQRKQA